jgi:uncharacterized protein (TIGR03435 family)
MTTDRLGKLAALLIGLSSVVMAQSPSFEVASVKPNKSDNFQSVPPIQAGRVTLTNRTLRYLVQFAYSTFESSLHDVQIISGPNWIDRDRFDIVAKMEGSPAPGPNTANLARLMLRTLLADRFQLKTRQESRELSAYALVVARPDARLGLSLRPRPDLDCEKVAHPPLQGFKEPDLTGTVPLCGLLKGGRGTLSFRGVPIASLLRPSVLGGLDRVVIDQTGLQGLFDIDLTWAVDASAPTDVPSIFTAVQEQLGLRLIPTRAAIEVLVIESAQQPSPD